jgi:hypothetical protein
MRRMGRWHKPDLIEVKLIRRLARHGEVGGMNGVEGATE